MRIYNNPVTTIVGVITVENQTTKANIISLVYPPPKAVVWAMAMPLSSKPTHDVACWIMPMNLILISGIT